MRVKTPAREIIKPYVDRGMSIQEIAEITGLKYSTVQAARLRILGKPSKSENIKRKKGWNKDRHACKTCQWRGSKIGRNGCDFIILVRPNHSRGCKVEDCDKYIRGARIMENTRACKNIDEQYE